MEEPWEYRLFNGFKDLKEEFNPVAYEQRFRDEWNQSRLEEEMGEEKALALRKYSNVPSLSKEQALEILETIWPGAPYQEKLKAAMLCRDYHLNPLKKHVALARFGNEWVTLVSIDVDRLAARRNLGQMPEVRWTGRNCTL